MKSLIVFSLLCSLGAVPAMAVAQDIDAKAITKLAKDFDVSPDILSGFKDMSLPDVRSGLDIAKEVSKRGDMSMNDAASKVLGSRKGGKDWDGIAKDFDVKPPKSSKLSLPSID
jgi:hypothetical protein